MLGGRKWRMVLILVLLCWVIPMGAAAETYALEYGAEGELSLFCFTPFQMRCLYDNPEDYGGIRRPETRTGRLCHLTGPGVSIGAYFGDFQAEPKANTHYRRIDLEDSPLHEAEAARLRAVVLNSFPCISDLQSIAARANVWLRANAMTEIRELQVGEVILATQQAIWKLTHGESFSILAPYIGCGAYEADAVHTTNSTEQETQYTRTNIQGLYRYYLSLPGREAKVDAASGNAIQDVRYRFASEENGRCTVTIQCCVETTISKADELYLTAVCGGQEQTVPVNRAGTYTLTFSGMEEPSEATLTLHGQKTGGDVYIFDPLEQGPTLIGYDVSCLPVCVSVSASPERVLRICQTTQEGQPLRGIRYCLYRLETQDDPIREENRIATLMTDAEGLAAYNFTANGQKDGQYILVEEVNSAIVHPSESILFSIPGPEAGYTVTLSPKNTPEAAPELKTSVTQNALLFRCAIPDGIGNGESYVLSAEAEDIVSQTPEVTLASPDGEEAPLTAGIHYILHTGTREENGEPVLYYGISLTREGMYRAASLMAANTVRPELWVRYPVQKDTLSGHLSCRGELYYRNGVGMEYRMQCSAAEEYRVDQLTSKTPGSSLPEVKAKEASDAFPGEWYNAFFLWLCATGFVLGILTTVLAIAFRRNSKPSLTDHGRTGIMSPK